MTKRVMLGRRKTIGARLQLCVVVCCLVQFIYIGIGLESRTSAYANDEDRTSQCPNNLSYLVPQLQELQDHEDLTIRISDMVARIKQDGNMGHSISYYETKVRTLKMALASDSGNRELEDLLLINESMLEAISCYRQVMEK